MRNASRWIVATLAGAAIQACANSAPQAKQTGQANNEADVAAIKAVQEREMALGSTGNADSMMTVYTDDVDFMPADEPELHGREALKKWAQGMFDQAALSGRYTSADVTASGDLAVVRYTGDLTETPKAGGAAATQHIKGVHVMKRQPDGSWRIALDVWNSNEPAAPPSPPPAAKK